MKKITAVLKRVVGLGEYRGLPCKRSTQLVRERSDARRHKAASKHRR